MYLNVCVVLALASVFSLARCGSNLRAAQPPGTGAAPSLPTAFTTGAGVIVPTGWSLRAKDVFGTNASATVGSFAQLHAKYYEGQFYNRDANGLVTIPNTVINHEQQTYVHFEDAVVFAADHLTIQARGQVDNSITSAELVSQFTARSFCVEARYRIPSADKAWPAFWLYGAASGGDSSEIDFEQPITSSQGVHDVTMYNHPAAASLVINDTRFTTPYMNLNDGTFDGSAGTHAYTVCYEDATSAMRRYVDGALIYSATWTWNGSMGGTGHGPDATVIVNLAVGGDWPGNTANPASFSADLDLYSLEYYTP